MHACIYTAWIYASDYMHIVCIYASDYRQNTDLPNIHNSTPRKELPNLFLPKMWFIPNPCVSLRYQSIIPIPSLNNYERCLIRPSSLPAMRNRGLTEDCGFKSSRYNSIYFLISIKIEVSMVTNL